MEGKSPRKIGEKKSGSSEEMETLFRKKMVMCGSVGGEMGDI